MLNEIIQKTDIYHSHVGIKQVDFEEVGQSKIVVRR